MLSHLKNSPTVAVGITIVAALLVSASHGQECDCKLTEYKTCNKAIDMAVLMQNSTAIQALPVIYLAKKDLEEQGLRGPLQDWSIRIKYRDTKGSNVDAALEAFRLHHEATERCQRAVAQAPAADCGEEELSQLDVFLGPVESYSMVVVTRHSTRWKTPVLSPAGKIKSFDDEKYQSLYKIHGQNSQLASSIRKMWAEWGWNVTYLLFEDYGGDSVKGRTACFFGMDSIYKKLLAYNYTVHHIIVPKDDHYDPEKVISTIGEQARIVLMCFENRSRLIDTMRAARNPRYASKEDYVFINVDIKTESEEDYWPWLELDSTIAEAFEPMFVVTPRTPATDDYRNFTKRVRTLASDPDQKDLRDHLQNITANSEAPASLNSSTLVSPFIASFYEGVWFFVEAFNRTLELKRSNPNISVKTEIFNQMNTGTFYSHLKKRNYTLTDRTIPDEYSVLNWQNISGKKLFQEVVVMEGTSESTEEWKSNNATIYWYGKNYTWEQWRTSRPTDSPECGFKEELCKTDPVLNLVVGLSIVVIILLFVVAVGVRRWLKLRSKVEVMYHFRTCQEDLVQVESNFAASTSTLLPYSSTTAH